MAVQSFGPADDAQRAGVTVDLEDGLDGLGAESDTLDSARRAVRAPTGTGPKAALVRGRSPSPSEGTSDRPGQFAGNGHRPTANNNQKQQPEQQPQSGPEPNQNQNRNRNNQGGGNDDVGNRRSNQTPART